MIPDDDARGLEVEGEDEGGGGRRDLVALALVDVAPHGLEIAHPAGDGSDDVNVLADLQEPLRCGCDARRVDAGLRIERVGVGPDECGDAVLEQAVDEDDIAADQLLATGHLVADDVTAMADELEVQVLHQAAGLAGARRGLPYGPQPAPEGEIGRFNHVLQLGTVDRSQRSLEEHRVAFELGDPERRAQRLHNGRQQVRDDVVGVVELHGREETRVAGDVGNQQAGGFGLRLHRALLQEGGA